jgi:hypothetical protein
MASRSLLERSRAKSIMDRSKVRKGEEYLELSAEGIPEKPLAFEKHPHLHYHPEEHKFLHGLGQTIRHRMGITGDTPSERIASILSHVEHGIHTGVESLKETAERKRYELGGAVAPSEAVTPTAVTRGVEIPSEEIQMPMPSEEILVCRKARKLEAVV